MRLLLEKNLWFSRLLPEVKSEMARNVDQLAENHPTFYEDENNFAEYDNNFAEYDNNFDDDEILDDNFITQLLD